MARWFGNAVLVAALLLFVSVDHASAHTNFYGNVSIGTATSEAECDDAANLEHNHLPCSLATEMHKWHGPVVIEAGVGPVFDVYGDVAVVPHHLNGDACIDPGMCISGYCTDGYCCDGTCAGGCGSCAVAGHAGACWPLASGTVCRAEAGACDVAEVCGGTSFACPDDAFVAAGSVCDPWTDAECSGSGPACPTSEALAGEVLFGAPGSCGL